MEIIGTCRLETMETDSGFRTEEGSPKEESPSSKVRPLFFRTDNLSWLPFDRDSQIYYSLVRRGTRTKRSERPEIEWLPGRKARRSKDLRWFCKENEIKTFWRKVLLRQIQYFTAQDEGDEQIEEMIEDISSSQSLSLGQWTMWTMWRPSQSSSQRQIQNQVMAYGL